MSRFDVAGVGSALLLLPIIATEVLLYIAQPCVTSFKRQTRLHFVHVSTKRETVLQFVFTIVHPTRQKTH